MSTRQETKACKPCATAKRRCGRETPRCPRCRTRGIECTYPSTKSTRFILCGALGDDTFQDDNSIQPCSTLQSAASSSGFQSVGDVNSSLSFVPDIPGLPPYVVDDVQYTSWFPSPQTWEIDDSFQIQYDRFTTSNLNRLMTKIWQWLSDWVEKGSSPFIHSQLYRNRFPRCVQVAYTILSCYLHKTPSNEQTIFRIIEDRANELVAEHGAHLPDPLLANITSSSTMLDPHEHLARVHALLIYQIISLYDGNIRLRFVAESHIPVLDSWTQQMIEHASRTVNSSDSVKSSTHTRMLSCYGLSETGDFENLPWYSWILTESIRRTSLVASGIQGAYLMIRQGRSSSCQGSTSFAARQGLWEVQSGPAWEELCSKVNMELTQLTQAGRLLTEAAPQHIDEFARFILQVIFGQVGMEM